MRDMPDEALCRALMDRYGMLPNIVEHSYRVCQVALLLAQALSRTQNDLDLGLVMASCLLHDITKTRSLKTKEDHALTAGILLAELGYPRVGEVVRAHVHLQPGEPLRPIREDHILNYADKRVRHSTVVSLDDRFLDLVNRYGHTPLRRTYLERVKQTALALEREIFREIDLLPEDLLRLNALSPFDLAPDPLQRAAGKAHLSSG